MEPDDNGNLALHLAAERGHLQMCVTLLNHMETCQRARIGTPPPPSPTHPQSLLPARQRDDRNNEAGH